MGKFRRETYFVETSHNLVYVIKSNSKKFQNETYFANNHFFSHTIISCDKMFYEMKPNGKVLMGIEDEGDKSNLLNDIFLCRKAIFYIELFHFYLKIKYLLVLFDGVNDIIKNISVIYFERALLHKNISNIRCKFEK